jgi:hypothetical protein
MGKGPFILQSFKSPKPCSKKYPASDFILKKLDKDKFFSCRNRPDWQWSFPYLSK